MSFRAKVQLVLLLVGVVPVALLGGSSYAANLAQLREAVGRLQAQAAQELARTTGRSVLQGVEGLRLAAEYLPLERLTPEETGAVLRIPFRQLPALNLLALLDGSGRAVAPAVFAREVGELPGRAPVDGAALATFAGKVPLEAAKQAGAAVGPPYAASGRARVALAVGLAPGSQRLLAAELDLGEVQQRLEAHAQEGGRALVVDATGRPVTVSGGPSTLGEEERALISEGMAAGASRVREVRGPDGVRYLAAFAPVPELGWGVLTGQEAARALAPARRMAAYTVFWTVVALLVSGVLGTLLAKGVSAPVAQLSAAVRGLREGSYAPRVEVTGRDELGALARAFNHMADALQQRDAEIRAWGEQLQQRVEEKTRQLREAQDQVQRARRLAALGSFSAGVAHELNNPLTGIIGLTTLLQREAEGGRTASLLPLVLEQARRMARVVEGMRQLARQEEGGGQRFSPLRPLRAALEAVRPQLPERGITLQLELPPVAPEVRGDPEGLQQVFAHLLQNALSAMPRGGTLTVGLTTRGPEVVQLWVRDTGRGIPEHLRERIFDPFFTTKDEPGQVGLGLSVSHRIVEAHHGRLSVESEEGRGSTFTLLLPVAAQEAHLV